MESNARVKCFRRDRGYGFLELRRPGSDHGETLYVHWTEIQGPRGAPRLLFPGQRVLVGDVRRTRKPNREALDVRPIWRNKPTRRPQRPERRSVVAR